MSGRATKRAPAPPPVCDLERLRAACAVAYELKKIGDGSTIFAEVAIAPDSATCLGLPTVTLTACLSCDVRDDGALLERLFSRVHVRQVRPTHDSARTEDMHGRVDDVLVFLEGRGLVEGLLRFGPGACREAVTS